MKRFSETKYYVSRSEKECLKLSYKVLNGALWIDFEGGRYTVESICVFRGHIKCSSNHRGLIQYRRGQYIHTYYCTDCKMGKILRVVFPVYKKQNEAKNGK